MAQVSSDPPPTGLLAVFGQRRTRDWTASLRPPKLPPLTSSRLNPTKTPHKEGEELKKGEGADQQ
uniref:Uncharacterized protein n=1 Tax=Oryza punctata TaxID=4537 RepID=A0A0E0KVS0_ORYPU